MTDRAELLTYAEQVLDGRVSLGARGPRTAALLARRAFEDWLDEVSATWCFLSDQALRASWTPHLSRLLRRDASAGAIFAETVFQQVLTRTFAAGIQFRGIDLESATRFVEYAVQDFVDGVEFLLPADQWRRHLDDWVAAVVGTAIQPGLEECGGELGE